MSEPEKDQPPVPPSHLSPPPLSPDVPGMQRPLGDLGPLSMPAPELSGAAHTTTAEITISSGSVEDIMKKSD